jgi:hypothetical protein
MCRCGSLGSRIEGIVVNDLAELGVLFYMQTSPCFLRLDSGCAGNSLRQSAALVALLTEGVVHYWP